MIRETFFGSISLYHTASENLLERHFSENEGMRINRKSFTNCRPFKVFRTNELFVPRTFSRASDASHDSLAFHG